MTENTNKRRRITLKYKSANPLFEQWLNEWKKEAKENGSKLEYTYGKALCSLKKCPILLNAGQDCKILKGFGDHLCKLLDQRLREHKSRLSDNQDTDLNGLVIDNFEQNCIPTKQKSGKNKTTGLSSKSKNKKIVPKELTRTPECEEIEINNIEQLENVEKRKITQHGNARQITPINSSESTKTELTNSQQSQTSCDEDFYILEPGNFDVILYVDTAETSSDRSDPLLKELNKLSDVCQFEVKKLHIGDYIWICRDKTTKKELVLPYIFERKRLDDLASSIKDGRYKEQKYRLKRSGIENKYYLIEKCQKHISFPLTSLQQAAINTAVQDGFKIKTTLNLNHTARLLNKFSLLLIHMFESKTLLKCPKENLEPVNLSGDLISLMSFKEFNQSSIKNKPMKVTDLFIKMLIQIKGMSVGKAIAISQQYPTPLLLKKAVDESDINDFQKCLSELTHQKQKVGVPLSKIVVQLFTSKQFK